MTQDANHAEPRDTLSIGRLLLLTAGVATGLALFGPVYDSATPINSEWWRYLANAALVGLALPAPLFCIRPRRARPLGAGGFFALAAGLGAVSILPAAAAVRIAHPPAAGEAYGLPATCIGWVLPLMGLWFFVAMLVSGQVGRRMFWRASPWTDRYGFWLALGWSPLGVWLLVEVYSESFR
ncbi:MAG: hypothetical protein HYX69_18360 [Planctomycetia bacterium]|nr:hypothetical protein [Planctomycetia bacterium]